MGRCRNHELNSTYDPALNVLYWCTSNRGPIFTVARAANNLFRLAVALDADTVAEMVFPIPRRMTHCRWDAQAWPVPPITVYEGHPRKLVVHANRNGGSSTCSTGPWRIPARHPYVELLSPGQRYRRPERPIEDFRHGAASTANVRTSVRGTSNWMSPSTTIRKRAAIYVPTLEDDIYTSSQERWNR